MDGNLTPSMPQEECFASVVSTEAVCLGFVLAQIQGLQCIAGDVGNVFLTAFTHKKIHLAILTVYITYLMPLGPY